MSELRKLRIAEQGRVAHFQSMGFFLDLAPATTSIIVFDTLATPRNVDPSGWGQEDVLGLLKRVAELAAGSDEAMWKELIELYAPALRIFVRLTAPSLPEADVEDAVRMVHSRVERMVVAIEESLFR